jgi:hypothetical protein
LESAQWFNITAQVQKPTLNNILAQLAANASPTLTLGLYARSNPDTVAIKTQAAMVIPHKYVGQFLTQPNGIPLHYYFDTPPPSWRLMVLWEHASPSPRSPPCRLFCPPHLPVMSPSSHNPTSFSATTFQPCWAPSHPLMISSHWLRTTLLTKNEQTVHQDQAQQEKIKKEVPQ